MKTYRLCICSSNLVFWLSCVAYFSANTMPTGMPTGPETSQGNDEKIGIQGNWIKKRDWLIKANEVSVEIQSVVNQTEQIRASFTTRYNVIDSILDEYYKNLGLGEGKIKNLLDSVSRYLEKKKKKELAALTSQAKETIDPDVQAKIDVIQESVTTSKQQLDQLILDMKSIEDLDKSLSDRLKRLDEQINLTQEEAARGKVLINDLWSIIDHNKARACYYELKNNILEKVKTTQAYLNEDLSRDFDSVIETIKGQITRTQEQIKAIEADGIFIKDRMNRIKELKAQQMQDGTLTPTTLSTPPAPNVKKSLTPPGLLDPVYDFFMTIFSKLYSLWLTITGQSPTIKKPVPSSTKISITLPAPAAPLTQVPPSASPGLIMPGQPQPVNIQETKQVPVMPSA